MAAAPHHARHDIHNDGKPEIDDRAPAIEPPRDHPRWHAQQAEDPVLEGDNAVVIELAVSGVQAISAV